MLAHYKPIVYRANLRVHKIVQALVLFGALFASVASADVRVSRLDDKGRFADIDLQGEPRRCRAISEISDVPCAAF